MEETWLDYFGHLCTSLFWQGEMRREMRLREREHIEGSLFFAPITALLLPLSFIRPTGGSALWCSSQGRTHHCSGSVSFGLLQHQTVNRLQSSVSSSERIPYQVYRLWKAQSLSHLSYQPWQKIWHIPLFGLKQKGISACSSCDIGRRIGVNTSNLPPVLPSVAFGSQFSLTYSFKSSPTEYLCSL